MKFPSPKDVAKAAEERALHLQSRASEYAEAVASSILKDPPTPDTDGWMQIRNPSLPADFTIGSTVWAVLRVIVGNDWEIGIWTGSPRDPDHTFQIRSRER